MPGLLNPAYTTRSRHSFTHDARMDRRWTYGQETQWRDPDPDLRDNMDIVTTGAAAYALGRWARGQRPGVPAHCGPCGAAAAASAAGAGHATAEGGIVGRSSAASRCLRHLFSPWLSSKIKRETAQIER